MPIPEIHGTLFQSKNFKQVFQTVRQYLSSHADGDAQALARELARWMDTLLILVLKEAQQSHGAERGKPNQQMTLCAVGGYGREELFPFSDIDLLFIVSEKSKGEVEKIIEKFLYRLWDFGLVLGHSVRTLDQCVQMSKEDVTVATALLDCRFLVGDEGLQKKMMSRLYAEVFSKKTLENFIKVKLSDFDSRHLKYGDSVYLLEPNVKSGRGGLRDLNTLEWILKSQFKQAGVAVLKTRGLLSKEEIESYERAKSFLFRVRFFLHLRAERNHEVLDFESQRAFAETYHYDDEESVSSVEKFMREFYLNGKMIERLLNQVFYHLFPERFLKGESIFRFSRKRNLEGGLVLHRGLINPGKEDLFSKEPKSIMAAFRAMQTHKAQLSPFCLDLIRKHLSVIDDRWRKDQEIAQVFRSILKDVKQVYSVLFAMHESGFLSAYFPEFAHLQCFVQHDLYHIYTVDAHLLFAVREFETLCSRDVEKNCVLAKRMIPQIDHMDVLVLAILFHDIGKGLGKGHSIRGADLMPGIAARLGFNAEETALLKNLVLHHLLMAHITQRRDIRDPQQIEAFSKVMGQVEMLRCLYVLTICDMKAVGPEVFNDWKCSLLTECYQRTLHYFESGKDIAVRQTQDLLDLWSKVQKSLGGKFSEEILRNLYGVIPPRFLIAHSPAEIANYIRFISAHTQEDLLQGKAYVSGVSRREHGFFEIWVYTGDRPGLFALICGVLTANRLNILGVEASTWEDGRVFNVYRVVNVEEKPDVEAETLAGIERQVGQLLRGETNIETLLQGRRGPWVLKKKSPKKIEPRAIIDNRSSDFFTVIEVFARDRIGLLFDIARVFQQYEIYIQTALISTDVDQVADVFYVKDGFGNKMVDAVALENLRENLIAVLAQPQSETN